MTMPHLMNCPHAADGWCLACVKEQHDLVERLRARLLTAAGDDLCRLTQEEIKDMSLGAVQIPPKEEFLASCERFHAQVAGEAGVMGNCLTLAQLVAENEKLEKRLADIKRCWVDGIGQIDNPWRRKMAELVGDTEGIAEATP